MIQSAALHAEPEEEVYNLSAASIADLSSWLQVNLLGFFLKIFTFLISLFF